MHSTVTKHKNLRLYSTKQSKTINHENFKQQSNHKQITNKQ